MPFTCREEILAAIADLLRRSGRDDFTLQDVLTEMRRRGSRYAESTIRTHVVSRMCANAPDHHGTTFADLERLDRGTYRLRVPATRLAPPAVVNVEVGVGTSSRWPWEGSVQAVFVDVLRRHGWAIDSEADTATKARGVDVLATRSGRRLGAEVKGWPSDGYADPRRAAETKRTQPSTQAGHWFSQALFKAMMLLDSHPGHETLMVLPDYRRYRDLTERTRTGRGLAGIHVVLVSPDGSFTSESWTP
ncbi:hypothetical protein GCM10010112_87820 [Actinoplanes lobatus]|uniref:DUF7669 domain-containing protein n=1 Tax=Actinoplanes lobatus TaxID=113568 RepID=A0ABQ4AX79_9ACTN|nr:hypothetical protein GCM10010112_87820 [Actinoplanes lobatus]GIE45380.1 hypothetical protein Alo02nite_82780 [Actinoplanes lobatus]